MSWDVTSVAKEYLELSQQLIGAEGGGPSSSSSPPEEEEETATVTILLLQSGRFAGGCFSTPTTPPTTSSTSTPPTIPKCLVHRVCTRYTTRKGQGGSQSSNDQSKGKAKSMGAQLRRAGEVSLRQDIKRTLLEWKSHIQTSHIIFIHCPRTMKKGLFDDASDSDVFGKGDGRIRNVPMILGRPTYEEVLKVYRVLLYITVRPMTSKEELMTLQHQSNSDDAGGEIDAGVVREASSKKKGVVVPPSAEEETSKESIITTPYTPLHEAAMMGNLVQLEKEIDKIIQRTSSSSSSFGVMAVDGTDGGCYGGGAAGEQQQEGVGGLIRENNSVIADPIDLRAGPLGMTALHLAAQSTTTSTTPADDDGSATTVGAATLTKGSTPTPTETTAVDSARAAACLTSLLLKGHANPSIVDNHNRPPYYLCSHEKTRNAFRLARHALGEDTWDWDNTAKVGPPLSEEGLSEKKSKAAEKKRKQRLRQKEKKAKEKAETERAKVEEERKERERREQEEAKRIRDGLQPKKKVQGPDNICDFCQEVAPMRRKLMYQKLDYVYCSTDCVKRHQRELMAMAASARLGGAGNK